MSKQLNKTENLETKSKGGRPPLEITAEMIKQAEECASKGMTIEQIADYFGMGESTFYDKQSRFPEFKEAIKRGRSSGIKQISNVLFEKAVAGDTTSAIFYLKSRAGWRDKGEIETEQPVQAGFVVVQGYDPEMI